MATLVGQYNAAATRTSLGSFPITGFGEEDMITITPKSDLRESVSSADGKHVAYSSINDNRHDLTIMVLQTSPAYPRIAELMEQQLAEAEVGAMTPLPFMFYDPVSGDRVAAQAAIFMKRPEIKRGKKVGVMEFKLELPNPRINYAPNLV